MKGSFRSIRVTRRGASPRVVSATIVGSGGSTTVTGAQLRARLGLFDSWVYFNALSTNVRPRRPDGTTPGRPPRRRRPGGGLAPRALLPSAPARAQLRGRVIPRPADGWVRVQRRAGDAWVDVVQAQVGRRRPLRGAVVAAGDVPRRVRGDPGAERARALGGRTPGGCSLSHDMDGKATDDLIVARIAEEQHGLVTRGQLLAAGIGRGAFEHRLGAGRLIRVHRGVYAVGHLPRTREAAWMAAVLACGDEALLSNRSGGALWGIRRWAPNRPDVTVPTQRRRPGIAVHVGRLAPADRAIHRGIPVTSVARTLVDLAHVLPQDELERVVREHGLPEAARPWRGARSARAPGPREPWPRCSTGSRRRSRDTRTSCCGSARASGSRCR